VRVGAIATAIALAIIIPAIAAAANTATFTSRTPASGSSSTNTRPTVSVSVYDRYGVHGVGTVTLTLDGGAVTPLVRYTVTGAFNPATGYRRFKVSYTPPAALAIGRHTVTVRVSDLKGKASATSWSFTVAAPYRASFSFAAPAGATPVGSRPTVSVVVYDKYGISSSAAYRSMTIDGIARSTTITRISRTTRSRVSCAIPASSPLGDGAHTAIVTVRDVKGLVSSYGWTFQVDTTPPTTTLTGAFPIYELPSGQQTALQLSATDSGVGVAHTYYSLDGSPTVEGTFIYKHFAVGPHTLTYWSVDKLGNVEAPNVETATMAPFHSVLPAYQSLTCFQTGCHVGSAVGTTTIDLGSIHASVGGCPICHASGQPTADCAAAGCHGATNAYPVTDPHPAHHPAIVSTSTPTQCTNDTCHTSALIYAGIGSAYLGKTHTSCATCHNDSDPAVVIAIANGESGANVTCETCHFHMKSGSTPTYAAIHAQDGANRSHAVAGSCYSSGCHGTDVSVTHTTGQNPPGCTVCHPNSVHTTTLHSATTDCGACHSDISTIHDFTHRNATGTQSAACVACHGTDLPSVHASLGCVCHFDSSLAATMAPLVAANAAQCTDCHTSIDHISVHVVNQTGGPCVACHPGGNLIDIHGSRDSTATCALCHSSPNPTVELAIASGVTTCTVCHGADLGVIHPTLDASHDVDQSTETTIDSANDTCATCHAGSNLITIHVNNYGLTCGTCHEDTSTVVGMAIALGETSCSSCHPGSSISAIHGPIATSHAVNPATTCLRCHAGDNLLNVHISADTTLTCDTCHSPDASANVTAAIASGETSCSACHNFIDHVAVHTVDPSGEPQVDQHGGTCAECHSATDLVDVHGSPDSTATCAICHSPDASATVQTAIASGQKNCSACHDATVHAAIHAADQTGDTCNNTGCHPGSNLLDIHINPGTTLTCTTCHSPDASANVTAAIASGETSCSACHNFTDHNALHDVSHRTDGCSGTGCHPGSNLLDIHIYSVAYGMTPLSCPTCHAANASAIVQLAIASSETSCGACHLFTDHNALHVTDQSGETQVDQYGDTCATCHAGSNLIDIHVTTYGLTCDACHATNAPANVKAAIASGETTCSVCHGTGLDTAHSGAVNSAHEVDNRTDACVGCHAGTNLLNIHVTDHGLTCVTCHGSNASANVKAAIASGETTCGPCHGTDVAVVHPSLDASHAVDQSAETTVDVYGDTCATCHAGSNLIDIHGSRDSTGTCAICHSSGAPANVQTAIASGETTCAVCHNTGFDAIHGGVNAQHNVDQSTETPVDQAGDTCATCHAGSNLLGIHINSGTTLTCVTCHGSNAGANVKAAIASSETTCAACHGNVLNTIHPSLEASHAVDQSSEATVDVYGDTCATCHVGSNLIDIHVTTYGLSCAACHASNAPTNVKAAIASGETTCAVCHGTTLVSAHVGDVTTSHAVDQTGDGCNDTSCHPGSNLLDIHINSGTSLTCATCHAAGADPSVKTAIASGETTCAACHGTAGHYPIHNVVQTGDGCDSTSCHPGSNLLDIHINSVTAGLTPLTCADCHSSNDASVTAAIANGQVACSNCHVIGGHYAIHAVDQTGDNCVACHAGSNLIDIHITNGGSTCATCHSSGNSNVQTAIANQQTPCANCHSTDTTVVHANEVSDHTQVESDQCAWCHGSPGNNNCHNGWGSDCDEGGFSYDLPAIHASVNGCATCHTSGVPLGDGYTVCQPCHDIDNDMRPSWNDM
jgi:hypothetical protein